MLSPIVSVVMPAFNAAPTIRNAIGSIIDQTFDDWELIVVDDGSTDHTEQEVKKFNDPRIRYERFETNHGIVTARNYGNALSKGKWIAMQDADDHSMPDRLMRSLESGDGVDVLYHGIYMNMYNSAQDRMQRTYHPAPSFDRNRIVKEQYLPGACIFRRLLWERHPFRESTKHAFDWMMHIDWSLNGAEYQGVKAGLYEYVRVGNSASIRYEKSGKRDEAFNLIKEVVKKEYAPFF